MQIIFDMRYLLLRKFYEFEIFLFNNDLQLCKFDVLSIAFKSSFVEQNMSSFAKNSMEFDEINANDD